MSRIVIGVAHAPHRPERKPIMDRMLADIPWVPGTNRQMYSFVVSDVHGPTHVWSEAVWDATEALATQCQADHCLFANDDLIVEPSFWTELPKMVAAYPDDVMCFHTPHEKFAPAYEQGADWALTWDGMIGNLYLMPTNVLRNFRAFRKRDMKPEAVIEYPEDAQIALYCQAKHRPVMHPMPSPFSPADVKSTWAKGDAFKYRHPVVRYNREASIVWPKSWNTAPVCLGRVWENYRWQLRTHLTEAAVQEYKTLDRMYWLESQT